MQFGHTVWIRVMIIFITYFILITRRHPYRWIPTELFDPDLWPVGFFLSASDKSPFLWFIRFTCHSQCCFRWLPLIKANLSIYLSIYLSISSGLRWFFIYLSSFTGSLDTLYYVCFSANKVMRMRICNLNPTVYFYFIQALGIDVILSLNN